MSLKPGIVLFRSSQIESLDLHNVAVVQVEVIAEPHVRCNLDYRSGVMTAAFLICIGAKYESVLAQYGAGNDVYRNASTIFPAFEPKDLRG